MTINKKTLLIAAAAVAALGLILIVAFFGKLSSTKTTAVNMETGLSGQYDANRVYLSGYITGFYEQTGLAKAKTEKLDEILLGAVKGRYTRDGIGSPQQPFGKDSQLAINVISEAYPNLSQLDIYDKIVAYVQDKRTGYTSMQTKLRSQIAAYDAWRNKGLIHPMFVKLVGAPRDTLEAAANGTVLHGQAALDQMKRLVIAEQATAAYDSGIDKPLTVPSE